jgi:hypothetical protein
MNDLIQSLVGIPPVKQIPYGGPRLVFFRQVAPWKYRNPMDRLKRPGDAPPLRDLYQRPLEQIPGIPHLS